jgi:predicted TIM-barrel fold metal-dependent hydrolase
MAITSNDTDGRPVAVEVVDGHHHIGVVDRSTWASADWRARDLDERVAYTRANDIDRFVALPSLNITLEHTNELYAQVNSMVAAYRADAPEVVAGAFAAVNPLVTGSALAELERCFTDLDMAGVVFHHRFLGISLDHPSMGPVVELAQAHDKVVAAHIIAESNLESAWRLFSLARRYPDARFLALDGFSSADQGAYLRDVAPDHPNVWFDTAVALSVAHGLAEFVDRCGADRLVIGTDRYSSYETFFRAFPVLEVAAMGLSHDDLEKVCHRNLTGLLSPR